MACTISSPPSEILGPGFFTRKRRAREDSEAEQTDGSTADSADEARLEEARRRAGRVNEAGGRGIRPVPPPPDYQADPELDQRTREHMQRRIGDGNNSKRSTVTVSPASYTAPLPDKNATKKPGKNDLRMKTDVHKRARRGQTSPHTSSGYASKAARADAPESNRGWSALGILDYLDPPQTGSTSRPGSCAN